MLKEVLMPKLGQTMEEGTIEKWHKQEGDTVEQGEVLFEVTTDKATLEVEAYAEGVLRKIVVEEGETVPCNYLVALVGDPDEPLPEIEKLKAEIAARAGSELASEETAAEPAHEEKQVTQVVPEPKEVAAASAKAEPSPQPQAKPVDGGRIFASPRARMVAQAEKVPLSAIKGTGPGGRIIERDVRSYVEQLTALKTTPTAREIAFQKGIDLHEVKPSTHDARIRKGDVLKAVETVAPPAAGVAAGTVIPLTAMRRVIAQRMSLSKQTVPHFYLFVDVDMGASTELRKRINNLGGPKVTFTDFLVKAAATALADNPKVNVRYEEDKIVVNDSVNIGIAVSVEDGLFVPVLRDADKKRILEIALERKELVDKARGSKLTPDDYTGGSITISNLGMFAIDFFVPIINPPESCIIGVGRISERVVPWQGGIHVRPVMTITLSGDHRAIDGASAAVFLKEFKELLESPEQLASDI